MEVAAVEEVHTEEPEEVGEHGEAGGGLDPLAGAGGGLLRVGERLRCQGGGGRLIETLLKGTVSRELTLTYVAIHVRKLGRKGLDADQKMSN